MDEFFQYPAPWEVHAEERKRRYLEGMRLLRAYGRIDLDDEFALDGLTDEGVDLEAYIFALEYERAKEHRANEAAPPPAAVARPTPAPPHPPNAPMPSRRADEVVLVPPGVTATAASSDELIETALRRFLKAKRLATQASTADKYGQQCRLFFKVVADGDPSKLWMSAITPQAIRRYADILPLLPAKVRLSDPRPIAEILASVREPIAPKTRFSHAQAVNMFLTFCQDQQYPTPAGFERILKPVLRKPAIRKADQNHRAFTDEELRLLFTSPVYRDGTHKRPSDYWVPLLGLFTGARQGELCQLDVGDVRCEGDVWMIDINDQGDKRLKTESSARLVPIHPQLIALGWLDYRESCRARGQDRLFPDEHRSIKGEFSAFSKRFARFRETCGVTGMGKIKKDFHSLRHSFQHVLYGLGVEKYVVQAITGHSNAGEGEGLRTYAPGAYLATMHQTICKIRYDLDLSHISPNGWRRR